MDTILAEEGGWVCFNSVHYLPRVISDHSPMSLHLKLGVWQGICHWQMEAYWLQEVGEDQMHASYLSLLRGECGQWVTIASVESI